MTTEIAVIEGQVVEPLSEGMARVLDKRIRAASNKVLDNMEYLLQLIKEAAAGQIWVALGFPSMAAYLKEAVQIVPVDKAERKQLAESLAGKGFSNRTTAAILSTTEGTIRNDLADAEGMPEEKDGLDGKKYPAKPKPKEQEPLDVDEVEEVEEVKEPRKATDVINDFGVNMDYLMPNVQAFNDLLQDDAELFPKARKRIAQRYLNRLQTAISDLSKVVDELME